MNNSHIVVSEGERPRVPSESVQYIMPASASSSKVESDDEIDLRELFAVLVNRLWLIILIASLVFFAVFVYTINIQPSYRASTTIQIESEESNQVLSFDVALGEGGNDEFYQTQYELLKSYTLARNVIEELGLEERFESGPRSEGLFSRFISYSKTFLFWKEQSPEYEIGAYPMEQRFLSGLSITPVKRSQIVRISYDANDPELAKNIVDAVASNFIAMTLQRRLDSAKDAQKFLADKVNQASVELGEMEQKLADYAKSQSIIQVDGESSQSLSAQKTAELNVAFTAAQGERIEAEARYRELSASQGVMSVLENSAIQGLQKTIVDLRSEYQKNLQQYKPGYPSMISLRKQIAQFQLQLENEIAAVKKAARSSLYAVYLAAKEKEESLQRALDAQKDTLLAERDRGIEYGNLLRQVGIQRQVYQELLLRETEVSIAAGIDSNNISVVDAAILPYQARSPNIKMNLALGGVLGLMLGAVIAFLLEFLSNGIKSSEELKKALGLPLLGVVPNVVEKKPAAHFMAAIDNPSSAMAEAYRSVRTNLLFSSADGVPKVISVTSAIPGEGKSSSCMNLATTFASSGKRVLLIDADMRKPVVHKHLKLDNSAGLSSFLSWQVEVTEIVQKTMIENVSVVTAGPIPPNPSELLSSARLDEIFAMVPEHFDVVIVDSPPIIGLADALVIANRVQATLMVSAYDHAEKNAVLGAAERLRQARANVLGVLFTKVKSGYGHTAYYGDEYLYKYGE
ncbi:polysaccharide biosynthesis tyrosine autokinase [Leucothrix sargassi]|nr:polysaccharide biosynthesis tyrosine autokinase [Leucothrix sargassi]